MPTTLSTAAARGSVLEPKPLVVKPKRAWIMLDCSNTRGYELLAAGELDSFLDGRSRKITVESIHRYVSRRIGTLPPVHEMDAPRTAVGPTTRAGKTPPRRRGHPRKPVAAVRAS
jgi:hypothetical protein